MAPVQVHKVYFCMLLQLATPHGDFTGNVAWAFYYGPAAVAALQAEMGVIVPPARQLPTIQSRMITFYSHATGRLTHDEFDFFMH